MVQLPISSLTYLSLSWILLSPSNQNSILEGVKFQPDQCSGLGTSFLSSYFFLYSSIEKNKLKGIFKQNTRSDEDLNFTLMLIKKYNIIKECYKKAEHFINLASNSLTVFKDCDEKKILENLTSFSLERSF